MKKTLKPFIYRIKGLTAWEREDLLEEIEKVYQDKKRMIIVWTVIGLTVTNIIVQTIVYLITGK